MSRATDARRAMESCEWEASMRMIGRLISLLMRYFAFVCAVAGFAGADGNAWAQDRQGGNVLLPNTGITIEAAIIHPRNPVLF
jgi:hypothetical protein